MIVWLGNNLQKCLVFFVAILVSSLFLLFALSAYPVPAGDSQFFVVPAVQHNLGKLMTIPLFPGEWERDLIIDPSGLQRFLFFPPLFPLIVSFFMLNGSALGAMVAIALLNIFVILLSVLLFYEVSRKQLNWLNVLVVLAGVLALAGSLMENGRPEVLARLWIVLGAIVYFYAPKKYDCIFYGILLGLMFATHPPAAIFSIFLLGIILGTNYNSREFTIRSISILILSVTLGLLAIASGPFGIRETIEGTLLNAVVVSHSARESLGSWLEWNNFFHRFIVSPTAPFYGLVLIWFGLAVAHIYRKKIDVESPYFAGISAALLLLLVIKVVLPIGHMFYFALFAPLIFGVIIKFASYSRWYIKAITIFILLLTSISFLRTALLFPFYLRQNATLEEARFAYKELTKKYNNKDVLFGVTGGFWTLTEDYKNVYSYNWWPEKPKGATALLFFQQRYSGLLVPPEIKGCNLLEDKFSREKPRFLGLELGNTMPGYGYAIYKCI